jgi:spectinomycin phosphotransferase
LCAPCDHRDVLEPPNDVSDADVLAVVRRHWEPQADAVEHLPVGWGAHHWRVDVRGTPTLFATLDPDLPRHTHASLESAYASAACLGVDFVWRSLPRVDGGFTLSVGARTASVAGWLPGERPSESVAELPAMLESLHSSAVPTTARVWTSEIAPGLAVRLRDLLQHPWSGPLGPAARELVVGHLSRVSGWAREHARLVALADPTTYVVTHGEPGVHNQWLARGRTWLLDWESLLLAPRERDLATLVHEGRDVDHDPAMVRLFDLEWRLSEVWAFATWLQGPHEGDADDRAALGGLTEEFTRPHFDERC